MSAKVTVLMLTYNQVQFVAQALESVLEQICPFEFSILLHDDFSSDGTREILREYEVTNPDKINIDFHPFNYYQIGRSLAAEPVLKIRTPFIAFCDGDDFWNDRFKLAKQIDFMKQNPWCSILHHPVEVMNDGGSEEYVQAISTILNKDDGYPIRTSGAKISEGNYLATSSVILRRDAIRDEFLSGIQGIQPEDWLVFSGAAESGDVGYQNESMATYRIHQSNFWATLPREDRLEKAKAAREYLKNNLRRPQVTFEQSH